MSEHLKDEMIKEAPTMVDYVITVRRVTKVTKGGKRFAFSALVVTGDKNGSVGVAQGYARRNLSLGGR